MKNINKNINKRIFAGLALAAVFAVALGAWSMTGRAGSGQDKPKEAPAAAQAQQTAPAEPWVQRCSKDPKDAKKENCEVFQRLIMKEDGKRFMEFAVGYPEKGDTARGVLVLPLGIMVNEGLEMNVDGKSSFSFKLRLCQLDGCYAFLKLTPQVLDSMRKGKAVNVMFMSARGQKINTELSLEGFGKALKKVKP